MPVRKSVRLWAVAATACATGASGDGDGDSGSGPDAQARPSGAPTSRRRARWAIGAGSSRRAASFAGSIEERHAIYAGRLFVAFELMGTPAGLDIHAMVPGEDPVELGGTVSATAGATLEVDVPAVLDLDPALPAPDITARILFIPSRGDPIVVAEGAGPILSAPLDGVGAYRVEIHIAPLHLAPYLGSLGPSYAENRLPWVYASPICVE